MKLCCITCCILPGKKKFLWYVFMFFFFRFLPETACFHKKQSDWTAAVAQGSLAWNIDWKARTPELLAPERRWNGWRSFDDAAGNPRGSQGRDSGPSLDQNVVEASNELRSIPMAGLVTALVDLANNQLSQQYIQLMNRFLATWYVTRKRRKRFHQKLWSSWNSWWKLQKHIKLKRRMKWRWWCQWRTTKERRKLRAWKHCLNPPIKKTQQKRGLECSFFQFHK